VKIKITHWTIGKCHARKDRINPKPQFQRTPVWTEPKKQLLIDSILRGYDLPKIYLNHTPNNVHHEYEVADGQQRLRAIWEFIDGGFNLNAVSESVNGHDLRGLGYADLSDRLRKRFDKYQVTVSVIVKGTSDELRVLFARLQMGMSLTPAELRNAIPCALAPVINTIVETHDFFKQSQISDKRYNRQDFLTHALFLADKDNAGDLKAPQLKAYYQSHAQSVNRAFLKKAHAVLDQLIAVNAQADFAITTKWGFVDLFWLVYRQQEVGRVAAPAKLAAAFVEFEKTRKKYVRRPEALLARGGIKGRQMYDYIHAFVASGGVKDRVATRARVFDSRFAKFFHKA
jgi:hypothetical protein